MICYKNYSLISSINAYLMQIQELMPQNFNDIQQDSPEEITQKYIRLVIVSASIFFQFVVVLAITSSLRKRFWPFKLILFSSCCEILLLILVIFSIFYNWCDSFCKLSGYFVHVLWLASISSQTMVMYLYLQYLESFYPKDDLAKRKLLMLTQFVERKYFFNCVILILVPSLFLLIPYTLDMFGQTGWRLHDSKQFFIYCGFIYQNIDKGAKNLIIFSIFWAAPLIILLIISFTKIYKIGKKLQRNDIIPEEHVFINRIIKIPVVSITCWTLNICLRISDYIIPQEYKFEKANYIVYIAYSAFNLIFELHIIVICLMFLTSFKQLLQNLCRKLTKISQDFLSISSHHIAPPQLEDPMLGSNNDLYFQNGNHQLMQLPEEPVQNNSQESINSQ
ncbi:hypothetical protein pb186bvf_011179 [Paramecium bursaria]